ncbi:MAG TPA: Hpt domain-containing protein [Caulobacteraceae bacterium]|nr:Hpt domain-containing protein [Caulobacteraceae bacterium]
MTIQAEALGQLRARFVARAADDLAALRRHLDGEQLASETLRFLVHRLAGAAGTFGYRDVGEAAGSAEDDLLASSSSLRASLNRLAGALVSLVDESRHAVHHNELP